MLQDICISSVKILMNSGFGKVCKRIIFKIFSKKPKFEKSDNSFFISIFAINDHSWKRQ